ncbi:DoxX family protein [Saccharopolyspora taberi]|uniref:DoxX family protein n=1 Tax=Saccharopolyspora taberi TaxID=60895 RepID=A0ABN3VA64_9PSEU
MTANANTGPAAASGAWNVVLWVLQVLIAALFLFGAYGKLTSDPLTVAGFEAMGAGQWLRYVAGVAELAGGVGLLIPVLSGLASAGLVLLLVFATVISFAQAPVMAVFPAVTLLVVAVVAWGRRDRTAQLLRLLSGRSAQTA